MFDKSLTPGSDKAKVKDAKALPICEITDNKSSLNDSIQDLRKQRQNSQWGMEFQAMLDGIRTALDRPDLGVHKDDVEKALGRYKSNPEDWVKFAEFQNHKYTRHLLDEHEDKYNVMLLCWDAATRSCIHDHSGSHCFMKVLDGHIVESRFSWPDENQNQNDVEFQHRNLIDQKVLGLDEVLYIHDRVGLHRIDNPDDSKKAVSLHVYIPPFKECQAFDQKTGEARICKLRFDTKFGNADN